MIAATASSPASGATFLSRDDIRTVADVIRNVFGLSTPLDVQQAVQKLGGKLRIVPAHELPDDCEAIICPGPVNDGTGAGSPGEQPAFTITMAEDRIDLRQKFSIAHELGHLFLHMGYMINPERWKTARETRVLHGRSPRRSRQELEADDFAAAFLMPEDEYRQVAGAYFNPDNWVHDLPAIARHFGVSQTAAGVRGRRLRIL